MNNNQSAIATAGAIILAIESAAILICFGHWFKAICLQIKETIKTLTKKGP